MRPLTTAGPVFTIVLIVLGVGTVPNNFSVILEAVTEGHLREQLERRRMDRLIAALTGHVVTCGTGASDVRQRSSWPASVTGSSWWTTTPVASSRSALVSPTSSATSPTMACCARRPSTGPVRSSPRSTPTPTPLRHARHASHPTGPGDHFPRTSDSKAKLLLAGASRAINPQRIGGRRMAVFALLPDVAEFLDVVMHDEDLDSRILEVHVGSGSSLAGRSLGELRPSGTDGALLPCHPARRGAGQPFEPHPPDELVVPSGSVLIALGTQAELDSPPQLARGR